MGPSSLVSSPATSPSSRSGDKWASLEDVGKAPWCGAAIALQDPAVLGTSSVLWGKQHYSPNSQPFPGSG